MVSKLALAVQEAHRQACEQTADREIVAGLAVRYHEITDGLGSRKRPEDYGAFPTDAHSHTPAHAGAQQPGMTGQVKEDLLARWGELGVGMTDGRLHFLPRLLRRSEFRHDRSEFVYSDVSGAEQTLALPPRALAFTVCQAPVVYVLSGKPGLEVSDLRGETVTHAEPRLSRDETTSVLRRRGAISRIVVRVSEELLFQDRA
ncbi:MAG: hypothetical protein ACREIA_00255 [Opitutaceae bacterium]